MARLSITIASDNEALIHPDHSDLEVSDLLTKLKAEIYDKAGPDQAASGAIRNDDQIVVGHWSWTPGITEGGER